MVAWHHDAMDTSLSKFRELVMNGEAWCAAINWLPEGSCPEASQEYCNNHLHMQHTILQCYIILKKMSKSEAALLGWPNPQVNTFPSYCVIITLSEKEIS